MDGNVGLYGTCDFRLILPLRRIFLSLDYPALRSATAISVKFRAAANPRIIAANPRIIAANQVIFPRVPLVLGQTDLEEVVESRVRLLTKIMKGTKRKC